MPITSSRDLFEHDLSDLYDAEHQFLEGQKLMRGKAADSQLQTMIETHMKESEAQITNLEQVFELLGLEPKRVHCEGAKGLLSEGKKMLEEIQPDELRDAAITGAATKVEHYEMVSYADLISGAELMGEKKIVALLEKNRAQEVETAEKMERAGARLLKRAAGNEGN